MTKKLDAREELAKAIRDFQSIRETYEHSDSHSIILAEKFLSLERDLLAAFFDLSGDGEEETVPKKGRPRRPQDESVGARDV